MTGARAPAAASATDMRRAGADVSDWEDPPRVPRGDTAPVLSVDGFAGPLDWLLEMARARKINLAKLSIGALIAQFADALAAALADHDTRQLDRWAGWTVMAATLTELWSRLLLPADPVAARAAEAEAEALRRRLLARARMRQAADWLERRPQLGRDVFAPGNAGGKRIRARQRSHRPAARLSGGTPCAGSPGGGVSSPAAAALAGQRRDPAPAPASRRLVR